MNKQADSGILHGRPFGGVVTLINNNAYEVSIELVLDPDINFYDYLPLKVTSSCFLRFTSNIHLYSQKW